MKKGLLATAVTTLVPVFFPAYGAQPGHQPAQSGDRQGKPMNVILFLVDDMGYGDLGYLGNKMVESPNVDAFARSGAVFTNAYATPESSPTRASILTGKNPARLHLTTWIPQPGAKKATDYKGLAVPDEVTGIPLSEYMLSEALRDNGYHTWHLGKWHIGEGEMCPRNQGFESDTGYWPWAFPKSYFSPYGLPTLSDGPQGEYLTDRLAEEAVKLIKERPDDKPFFLNFWHYAVHEPLRGRPDEVDYYLKKGAPEEGKDRAVYSAMKQAMDRSFGRVLQAVDEAGIADNTVIIFFTDNGGVVKHADNGPLRDGKKSLYEGGTRVPMVIRDPRQPGGVTIDTPVTSVDFYPTILEFAGIAPGTVKQHLDGHSFAQLLAGKPMAERPLFWHEMGAFGHGPATSMRQGNYKLLKFYSRPPEKMYELYDLSIDIAEQHNLASERPGIVKKMAKQMQTWIRDNDAQLPVSKQ